jgi:copper chaperone CopZ
VEKALKVMEGISEVRVNLEEGYAEIEDTIGIKDEELVSVVDEAGYKLETIINI